MLMSKNVNNDVSKDSPIFHLHISHNTTKVMQIPKCIMGDAKMVNKDLTTETKLKVDNQSVILLISNHV